MKKAVLSSLMAVSLLATGGVSYADLDKATVNDVTGVSRDVITGTTSDVTKINTAIDLTKTNETNIATNKADIATNKTAIEKMPRTLRPTKLTLQLLRRIKPMLVI